MKIILAIPPSKQNKKIIRLIDCSHQAKADYLWQPNDFMIITSLLKPQDGVVFIDGTANRLSDKEFFTELRKIEGDILFFALSSVCWQDDYYFFKKTKEIFTQIPIFVMGNIFIEKDYQELILNECDGIIFNPYLLDLENMLKEREKPEDVALPGVCTKIGQEVLSNSNKKISFIKSHFPRHEIFIKSGYFFPFAKHFKFSTVTTMWGCPFSCSYCPDSKFSPIVRYYQDILRELSYLSHLGVKELFFADKVFGFPYENSFPLLEEMSKKFHFSWSCYFHPQMYQPKLLELMRMAGCHTIITGIESANISLLEKYGRKVKAQNIELLVKKADRLGISICADLILGLEGEKDEDILNTFKYILELPLDFISLNLAAALPGTDLRRRAKEDGKLITGEEGADSYEQNGPLMNEYLSHQRLKQLRAKGLRKFYLRPGYIFRRLARTSSCEHLLIQLRIMFSLFRKSCGFVS